jgi:ketosteroid isomerase-like protein
MRTSLLAAVLALVACAILPVPATADPTEDSLRAAEQAFADAFARRDRAAFEALIHPDAVFGGGAGPLTGKAAVMEVWGEMLAADEAPFSWRPERVLVAPDGRLGVTTGPVMAPDGTHVGAFSSTWERQDDGGWLVIFDLGPSCPRCGAIGGDGGEGEAAAGGGAAADH